MVRSVVLPAFVGVMGIALSTVQQAQAAPTQGCGVNLAAPEIQTAIKGATIDAPTIDLQKAAPIHNERSVT